MTYAAITNFKISSTKVHSNHANLDNVNNLPVLNERTGWNAGSRSAILSSEGRQVPSDTTLLHFPAHRVHGVAGGWHDVQRTVGNNVALRCEDNLASPGGRSKRRRRHGWMGRHLAARLAALSTVTDEELLQSASGSETLLSTTGCSLGRCCDSAIGADGS